MGAQRILTVLPAVMLAAVVLALWPHGRAYACTGDGAAALAQAPMIIAGRVVGAVPVPVAGRPFSETLLLVAVDRYFRGSGPAVIEVMTSGAGTSCATGRANPLGQYLVHGLSRSEDGTLTLNALTRLGWGSGPDDPEVREGLRRAELAVQPWPAPPAAASPVVSPAAPAPPRTGNAGVLTEGHERPGTIAVMVTGMLLVAARLARRQGARRRS